MTVQTTYSIDHANAYAGMVADMQLINQVSRLNKTGAVIPYGKGVVTDTEGSMKIPTPTSTLLEVNGVVMYEINRAQADGAVAGAVDLQDASVISKGAVWVKVLVSVAKDDQAFLRIGSTDTGDFSNVVGAGVTLGLALTGSKFLTSAAADGLALLSLDNVGG